MNNTTYELIGSGSCGEVYSNGDIAYKKYFDDCFINRINKDVFDVLKTIDSDAFVKLMGYTMTNISCNDVIESYFYKYVNGIDDLMIDLPMEYTYETLHNFQVLLNKLNEKNIAIFDAGEDNVIKSNNGLVIIDPDLYSMDRSGNKRVLNELNKEYLVEYITSVLKEEYISKYNLNKTKKLYNELLELDNIFFECDTLDSNLKDRLNYKNPEELINNLVRKRSL